MQFFTFLNMILVGMIISIIFDFYRILKRKFGFSVYLTNLLDFLFFLVMPISILGRLIQINGGQLRWYIFFGVFSGAVIYYITISEFIINLVATQIDLLKEIYFKLKKIIRIVINRIRLIIIKLKKSIINLFWD
ncbi:MAG: spore cortex biosynthesis protein YabQ [Bacillota bacterium]